jgi:hypothetical protein
MHEKEPVHDDGQDGRPARSAHGGPVEPGNGRAGRTAHAKKKSTRRPRNMPYWIPRGSSWKRLPEGMKRAASQILAPAYRLFVRQAAGPLERSVGLTLVHLMWLEVCDQVALAPNVADRESIVAELADPEKLIARHLELVAAKCHTADLLVKLRMLAEMLKQQEQARMAAALPGPAAAEQVSGGREATAAATPRFPPLSLEEHLANG